MQLKRVVVTGIGALTPIGNTIEEYWDGLVNGKSGSAPITYYDSEKFSLILVATSPFIGQFVYPLGGMEMG